MLEIKLDEHEEFELSQYIEMDASAIVVRRIAPQESDRQMIQAVIAIHKR
jgi:hypothetical protein